MLHKTYAGTATVCTGVAAKIKGTLVNQVLHNDNPPELVRIGHPAGMIPCYSEVDENNNVKKAAIVRTARRLMEAMPCWKRPSISTDSPSPARCRRRRSRTKKDTRICLQILSY